MEGGPWHGHGPDRPPGNWPPALRPLPSLPLLLPLRGAGRPRAAVPLAPLPVRQAGPEDACAWPPHFLPKAPPGGDGRPVCTGGGGRLRAGGRLGATRGCRTAHHQRGRGTTALGARSPRSGPRSLRVLPAFPSFWGCQAASHFPARTSATGLRPTLNTYEDSHPEAPDGQELWRGTLFPPGAHCGREHGVRGGVSQIKERHAPPGKTVGRGAHPWERLRGRGTAEAAFEGQPPGQRALDPGAPGHLLRAPTSLPPMTSRRAVMELRAEGEAGSGSPLSHDPTQDALVPTQASGNQQQNGAVGATTRRSRPWQEPHGPGPPRTRWWQNPCTEARGTNMPGPRSPKAGEMVWPRRDQVQASPKFRSGADRGSTDGQPAGQKATLRANCAQGTLSSPSR